MKIHTIATLFTTILMVALFSSVDLQAQTTVYYNWPSADQPMGPNDPFNLRKVLTTWGYSQDGSVPTEKIYVNKGNGPASQLGDIPHAFSLDEDMRYFTFEKTPFGDLEQELGGSFEVNEDKNIRVTIFDFNPRNGSKTLTGEVYLLITDRIMEGVLTVRKISG